MVDGRILLGRRADSYKEQRVAERGDV